MDNSSVYNLSETRADTSGYIPKAHLGKDHWKAKRNETWTGKNPENIRQQSNSQEVDYTNQTLKK